MSDFKLEAKYAFWISFTIFMWLIAEMGLGIQGTKLVYKQASLLFSLIPFSVWLWISISNGHAARQDSLYMTRVISGSVTSMAGGAFIYILSFLFYKLVNPGYVLVLIEKSVDQYKLQFPESSEASIADVQTKAEALFSASSLAMQSFFFYAGCGIALSLIFAIFFKRKGSKF